MGLADSFGALRERRFRLLWFGQTTSTLGDGLVPVALSFAVIQTLDGSATALGIVLAAHMLPLVAFVLVGGVWADRLPRQFVMLGSDVIRGVVQATAAILLLSGAAEIWHLVVLIAVYGTAEAFFQPASTGLVPATVRPARLQQANALIGLSRSSSFIVGPAIAGVIAATTNPGIVFVVDAATFAVSAACLALLRLPRVAREGERQSFFADLAGGWRELVSHTWLWVIVAWASTYLGIVVAPFLTLGPVIAKESLGGASAWGIIAAGWGAGSLGGYLLALRWKPSRPMLVCSLLVLLVAPAIVLLALRAPALVIAVAQAIGGIGMGFFSAVWQTTLQQHVREEALSRVSAWDWMGSLVFLPLGFVLVGPVSDAIGISTTLWVSVAWAVLSTCAVLLVPSVRNLRRLDEPESEPDEVLAALPGEPAEALHGS
ncbi:MAG TPA: MFS transporter [Gaiellaceae bacterium]|nr:MFS transporter [Gaiellaceae bacterium]